MYYLQEEISSVKRTELLKTMAIVNIFETGKPFGEFGAVAVLNDGAGISYGISQFTHRSGSLAAVVERYLELDGTVGRFALENAMPSLRRKDPRIVRNISRDERLKKALRSAAITREMRVAQMQVAFEKYLQPAMNECERLGFELPLSLAVIHDSMTHGSYERFRDHIKRHLKEKEWITEYVRIRHRWLGSVKRLRATQYRTRFFLVQIALGRWDLKLPLNVHGYWLREEHIAEILKLADLNIGIDLAVGPNSSPHTQSNPEELSPQSSQILTPTPQAQPSISLGERIFDAAARFDQADKLITAVTTRTDRAKSLWTTVIGTVWQTAWAIFGFMIGLPRAIWFAVAILVAALTLFYLYRQITLGKLREMK